MPEDPEPPSAIPKPRLVLRVGFAGKCDFYPVAEGGTLPSKEEVEDLGLQIKGVLHEVFHCIGGQLIELAPHTPCQKGTPPAIAAYYARENPLLRVVSGLCEGSDTLAYQAAEGLQLECLEVENALVIGFPKAIYRQTREAAFLGEFDRQVKGAAYVLEADGAYEKGAPGKAKRNRAYRCQSDLLLRQSDLLVALVDPTQEGKAGGTLETLRKALALQIPVVLVNPAGLGVRILSAEENLADSIEAGADPDWKAGLTERVTRIVANPSLSQDAFQNEQSSHARDLLKEFFSGETPVPGRYEDGPRWEGFVDRFRSEKRKPQEPSAPWAIPEAAAFRSADAYKHYRDWASILSSHYAERFRNAFFRNSLFALAAVFLAGLSLLLLGVFGEKLSKPEVAILVVLALGKLILVLKIFLSAHQANHDHWNDRVVDYRYLAERLRAMLYLPAAGSWQPPAAAPAQYASRVVRQSAVDWLADAIVRSISPGAWRDKSTGVISLDPEDALKKVKEDWLRKQLSYHEGVALRMQRMDRWLRSFGEILNFGVLLIVAFDIALLLLKFPGWLPHSLKVATPYIVFVTAIIPAAVAAVNVLRLQSECERLAERSAVLVRILGGRKDAGSGSGTATGSGAGAGPESGEGVHHAAGHASGHGKSHDMAIEFLIGQWRKLCIVLNPRGKPLSTASAPADTPASATEGGKIRAAKDLLDLLDTPGENALGCHAGKVLHFTEGCAEIFVQEVAEWSVLYAKELVEP